MPINVGSGLAQAANSETQERKSRGGERAKRVAVQSLGAWQWGVDMESEGASAQVVHTVHRLKHLARSSRLAVMVSVPAGQPKFLSQCIQRTIQQHMPILCVWKLYLRCGKVDISFLWLSNGEDCSKITRLISECGHCKCATTNERQ